MVSARSLSKAVIKRGNEDSRLTEKAGEYQGIFKTAPSTIKVYNGGMCVLGKLQGV